MAKQKRVKKEEKIAVTVWVEPEKVRQLDAHLDRLVVGIPGAKVSRSSFLESTLAEVLDKVSAKG